MAKFSKAQAKAIGLMETAIERQKRFLGELRVKHQNAQRSFTGNQLHQGTRDVVQDRIEKVEQDIQRMTDNLARMKNPPSREDFIRRHSQAITQINAYTDYHGNRESERHKNLIAFHEREIERLKNEPAE